MDSLEKQIDQLEAEIDRLEERISEMERVVFPIHKPIPTNPWQPFLPNFPMKSYCPKCGLDITGPIGYCCPNLDCPVGLGPTICKGDLI